MKTTNGNFRTLMGFFFKLHLLLLTLGVPLYAERMNLQKECVWDKELELALDKYGDFLQGNFDGDESDFMLSLNEKKLNCLLDSVVKKDKVEYNPYTLLWLVQIPDSIFNLSPESILYLTKNGDVFKENAGRLLVNEKMKRKLDINKDIVENKKAIEFIEWLIYEHK
ncbi:hypothetical protein SAMN05720766_13212 [Fibrobacter sp. UWH9]|uniref:hypothetical protein n=1 Tax=Fibrobacter sp. UWH9 TaxID=1896213 RepID=UPI00091F6CFC|nr:hypothetical protein [Fibrobacter sp. UWH9]SHH87802.1 hypothetical protein SAMN05720766_13212 [Fibrobacter sp. UWH9]